MYGGLVINKIKTKLLKEIQEDWNDIWSNDCYENNRSTWKPIDNVKCEVISMLIKQEIKKKLSQ